MKDYYDSVSGEEMSRVVDHQSIQSQEVILVKNPGQNNLSPTILIGQQGKSNFPVGGVPGRKQSGQTSEIPQLSKPKK